MSILISIVTVVRNGESHIEKCMRNISFLKDKINYQHIVVDGNSVDGTVEICRNFECEIIFQEGEGIYNAMNLGIEKAKGDFVLFSNSDDYIDVDGVINAYEIIKKDCNKNHLFSVRVIKSDGGFFIWNPKNTIDRDYSMPCPHPGMFVKREYLMGALAFNESFSSSSDYLMCLLMKAKFDFTCHDFIVSNFNLGGESSSFKVILQNSKIRNISGLSVIVKTKGFIYDLFQYIRSRL
ncbi:glycosyltransferase [Marinomonas profundimaris]|uniref:Glycosyltransferase 2-like domain-containing protein n=1 Tax=Marinomonas profundimaris TaxID=1208321 RepID=W1RWR8_9GAMM|nr:glycosyltransferase [Marinomonas profundimaris]ETI61422.1 hypothetical protein D104_05720 [Marinomonas profundimaris]